MRNPHEGCRPFGRTPVTRVSHRNWFLKRPPLLECSGLSTAPPPPSVYCLPRDRPARADVFKSGRPSHRRAGHFLVDKILFFSVKRRAPTAVAYPPTAVGYPPTAVGYPPSAVAYPPTAVAYPPTPSLTLQPPSVTLQPPSVTLQPPSVTPQPPSITLQPPSLTLQPPSITLQPPSLTLQPPSLTLQPPSVTLQPPSVTLQPPSVTLQPPSITLQPPSITLQPPSQPPLLILGRSSQKKPEIEFLGGSAGPSWGARNGRQKFQQRDPRVTTKSRECVCDVRRDVLRLWVTTVEGFCREAHPHIGRLSPPNSELTPPQDPETLTPTPPPEPPGSYPPLQQQQTGNSHP